MKTRRARWQWATENGKSGLRPRPPGSVPSSNLDVPERDVITAQVPTVALLEAARAMTEPEPPADLGLYREEYRAQEDSADLSDEPPRSSRISKPALPLAAEFGLEHLIETDAKPARSWSMWLRAHGPWIAAGMLALWLIASFALHWLAVLL
jgi:hypothetical protein